MTTTESPETVTEMVADPERSGADFEARLKAAEAPAELVEAVKAAPVKEKVKEAKSFSDLEIPESMISPEKANPVEASSNAVLAEIDAMDPKSANFKQLRERTRAEIARQHDEVTRLKSELEDARANVPKADFTEFEAKVAASEKRAADMEAQLERVAFEKSPKFAAFTAKEQRQLDAAKSYLEGSDIPARVIDIAADAKGAARLKILADAGADPTVIAAISSHLSNVDEIKNEKEGALSQQKELSGKWSADEQRATKARQDAEKAEEDRVFGTALEKATANLAPFQKLEGNDAWNAQTDRNIEAARKFFSGDMSLPDMADIAIHGVGARQFVQINNALRERLNAANEKLAKMSAAQPDTKNGQPKPSETEGFDLAGAGARFEARMAGG